MWDISSYLTMLIKEVLKRVQKGNPFIWQHHSFLILYYKKQPMYSERKQTSSLNANAGKTGAIRGPQIQWAPDPIHQLGGKQSAIQNSVWAFYIGSFSFLLHKNQNIWKSNSPDLTLHGHSAHLLALPTPSVGLQGQPGLREAFVFIQLLSHRAGASSVFQL